MNQFYQGVETGLAANEHEEALWCDVKVLKLGLVMVVKNCKLTKIH